MSSAVKPPAHLRELVHTTFAKALKGGDLFYFATQFQLRFSPALANKPKPLPRHTQSEPPDPPETSKPFDPFAHPSPSLFMADVGPSHYLVLNKFAVVPGHFILATRAFKPQSHVLERADLEATMACLEGYAPPRGRDDGDGDGNDDEEPDGLFAFFNSGEHSGASQPHRHVQFLPVDQMSRGLEQHQGQTPHWSLFIGQGPGTEKEMPFVVFSEEMRPGMPPSEVHGLYLRLYREGCRAVMRATGQPCGEDAPGEGPALISYNLGLTSTRMVLCPRLAEGGPVLGLEGEEVGRLALNGTVLAGTALVKSEGEWEALRRRPSGLVDVLRRIGIPRDDGVVETATVKGGGDAMRFACTKGENE
ncbi:hypothetical protein E4U54_003063 [Claviceps lovelessii]|nr:hypothetical protein E4U54_003063 [Claviceps lovelessii]